MHMSSHPKDSFPQSGPKGPSEDLCQKGASHAKPCQYRGLSLSEPLQTGPGYSRPNFFLVTRFLVGNRRLASSDRETNPSGNFHAYGELPQRHLIQFGFGAGPRTRKSPLMGLDYLPVPNGSRRSLIPSSMAIMTCSQSMADPQLLPIRNIAKDFNTASAFFAKEQL